MSTTVLDEQNTRSIDATAGPYLAGGLAALSADAAAIHFAVVFEHFSQYMLYGVFFLIISWAQAIWAAVVLWRPSRPWLGLGIAGNALILAVYLASRTTGLPFGPDKGHPEPFGGLDVVSAILEFALIAGCAALLWRPSLTGRPVRRRGDRGDHGGDDPGLGRPRGTGGHGGRAGHELRGRGARRPAWHG